MLRECRESVRAQTFREWEHLVKVDVEREGCSGTVNELGRHAVGEWLFLIADDDLLLPDCLEAHLAVCAEADVVYGPPIVEGEDPHQFWGTPPMIPSTALIRASLWRKQGGYKLGLDATEDCDFYRRAVERRARFVRIDGHHWTYRFHGGNKSRQ